MAVRNTAARWPSGAGTHTQPRSRRALRRNQLLAAALTFLLVCYMASLRPSNAVGRGEEKPARGGAVAEPQFEAFRKHHDRDVRLDKPAGDDEGGDANDDDEDDGARRKKEKARQGTPKKRSKFGDDADLVEAGGAGAKSDKHRSGVGDESDPTWRREVAAEFAAADERCVASAAWKPDLMKLGKDMYSSTGGQQPRCVALLNPVNPYLPIRSDTNVHARCADPAFPSAFAAKLRAMRLDTKRRGNRKQTETNSDLWPTLQDHLSALDYVGIQRMKTSVPWMLRMCPPPTAVHRWYFDLNPLDAGNAVSSLGWFFANYPEAETFRTVAVGADKDLISRDVAAINARLAEAAAKRTEEAETEKKRPQPARRQQPLPTVPAGGGRKDGVVQDSELDVLGTASASVARPTVITYLPGMPWNDTGFVTQKRVVPSLTGAGKSTVDDGGGDDDDDEHHRRPVGPRQINIILTSEPVIGAETPVPPQTYAVGTDAPTTEPMVEILNDRMLATQFHYHPTGLDEAALNALDSELDDGLATRYGKELRTFPTVDVAEIILRHATLDDFVVVRINAVGFEWMLVEHLIRTGALRYVDELFLVCRARELSIAWNTHHVPSDCQEMFNTLRKLGVYVHEWYPY
jgi:hypothetical protein